MTPAKLVTNLGVLAAINVLVLGLVWLVANAAVALAQVLR